MPVAVTTPPHPHLPPPLGILSPWQRSTRSHPLLNAGKDDPLPASADVVIIGSGMCGAVTANALLKHKQRPAKIVVLEAREICSGASGRNAGHCRPDPHRGFPGFAKNHGPQEARRICESEKLVWDRVNEYIQSNGVSCEWTPRPTVDVALSDNFVQYSDGALDGVKATGSACPVVREDGEAAKKTSGTQAAHATYKWDAASLNPAQLTLHIHSENVSLGGYSLHAWAPVHRVIESSTSAGKWTVTTPRGSVEATTVIYATNAYTDALLPELKDLIIPVRAQGVHLDPAASSDGSTPFNATMSLRHQLQHFYSVATRPDHSVILGTSRYWPNMPPGLKDKITNTVDDSVFSSEITADAVGQFCRLFPNGGWSTEGLGEGKEGDNNAKGYKYSWTGIIGMTPDAVPLVGPVPGKDGQYCAAGYNGHGMARIFLCAPSLAQYILEGTWPSEMPQSFVLSQQRIDHLRGMKKEVLKTEIAREDLNKINL